MLQRQTKRRTEGRLVDGPKNPKRPKSVQSKPVSASTKKPPPKPGIGLNGFVTTLPSDVEVRHVLDELLGAIAHATGLRAPASVISRLTSAYADLSFDVELDASSEQKRAHLTAGRAAIAQWHAWLEKQHS